MNQHLFDMTPPELAAWLFRDRRLVSVRPTAHIHLTRDAARGEFEVQTEDFDRARQGIPDGLLACLADGIGTVFADATKPAGMSFYKKEMTVKYLPPVRPQTGGCLVVCTLGAIDWTVLGETKLKIECSDPLNRLLCVTDLTLQIRQTGR